MGKSSSKGFCVVRYGPNVEQPKPETLTLELFSSDSKWKPPKLWQTVKNANNAAAIRDEILEL